MAAIARKRTNWLGRLGGGVAWLGFVVGVAICGAGLTLALDHAQTDSGRPELTYAGDSIVGPRLAAMAPALTALATAADTLSAQSRQTYGHVRGRDTAAARADLPLGDAATTAVLTSAGEVQTARATLLDGARLGGLSQSNQIWVAAIDRALASAAKVPAAWTLIASAALLPISVVEALAHHDATILAATDLARRSDFAGATVILTDARADIDRARALAAQADEQGLDASTLTAVIDRSTAYDEALLRLYAILVETGGTMTAEAQTALDAVHHAEQALPKDTSALTVIVSDIGGQTMTIGLIDLDQLRGDILAGVNRPGVAGR